LPARDFSRELLERIPELLELVVVPPCGWTDLGTPARLERFLAPSPRPPVRTPATARRTGRADLTHLEAVRRGETPRPREGGGVRGRRLLPGAHGVLVAPEEERALAAQSLGRRVPEAPQGRERA